VIVSKTGRKSVVSSIRGTSPAERERQQDAHQARPDAEGGENGDDFVHRRLTSDRQADASKPWSISSSIVSDRSGAPMTAP